MEVVTLSASTGWRWGDLFAGVLTSKKACT